MRKEKKNYSGVIMTIFLAVIMVTSIAGFLITDQSTPVVRYNGVKFTATQNGWQSTIGGQKYLFSFTPKDVEYLSSPPFPKDIPEIDVTSDFDSKSAESIASATFEMIDALSKRGVYVRYGFTSNSTALPVLTCADATSSVPVLYFIEGNVTELKPEGACIYVTARSGADFLLLADRIIYHMMGIQ